MFLKNILIHSIRRKILIKLKIGFEKHIENISLLSELPPAMKNISLLLTDEPNTIGLTPVLQKSLDAFCGSLPKNNAWVQSKFKDVSQQLSTLLNKQSRFEGLAGQAFVDRVGLYILWRAIVQQYVGPALGISTESQNLCKRCPPLGITISSNGQVVPFVSRYTCKHLLCPSCRMRKVLITWNKFNEGISFQPGLRLDMVHFEVSRTFAFNGLATCDFKLDVLQDLLKRFKRMLWTYGGVWSVGITSKEEDVTIIAKCGAVCPPLPAGRRLNLQEFANNANYVSALAGQDMYTAVEIQPVKYEVTKLEKLFAKTLNTAIWPTSFMLDYSNPVSTLFAVYLDMAFRNQKTIGSFGPCDTLRKRLK